MRAFVPGFQQNIDEGHIKHDIISKNYVNNYYSIRIRVKLITLYIFFSLFG